MMTEDLRSVCLFCLSVYIYSFNARKCYIYFFLCKQCFDDLVSRTGESEEHFKKIHEALESDDVQTHLYVIDSIIQTFEKVSPQGLFQSSLVTFCLIHHHNP